MAKLDFYADSHVHIYPFMSVKTLLEAARRNLFQGVNQATQGIVGFLIIADPEGVHGFDRLQKRGAKGRSSGLQEPELNDSGDSRSVMIRWPDGTNIFAIKGQQLITSEGLEVLSAGCKHNVPSGLTLARTVERITAAGGWSIIAWGAGKWLGKRGRVVTNMIAAERGRPDIMLGDNGGRPWCWYRVPQFKMAADCGMRVLGGSDPLPLKGEELRVGSYGFRMHVNCDADQMMTDAIRSTIENLDVPIQTIGNHMSISGFITKQVRLRMQLPIR